MSIIIWIRAYFLKCINLIILTLNEMFIKNMKMFFITRIRAVAYQFVSIYVLLLAVGIVMYLNYFPRLRCIV
jgi:hypothetical protein